MMTGKWLAPMAMIGLAACGGGGGGSDNTGMPVDQVYVPLADTTATEATDLQFVAITNDGTLARGDAGTLDHDANTVTSGTLRGAINAARTTVTLDGGGTATLTNPDGTDHLRIFRTAGTATDDLFGVVGQVTNTGDLPTTGNPVYRGSVSLTVADGAELYNLDGDVRITADFENSRIRSDFDSFDGTRTDGGTTTSVTDAGTITITNGVLSGTRFTGGSVTTTGEAFELDGGGSTGGTSGQFFGPEGAEIGGVVRVTESGGGRSIFGVYSAD
ncbi:transferrin-binding protein-like solute binding protein [Yoonia sp. SS1-5]|uniref:Transferrin-binding protein-like solute binding protein n=1 Tax=Yoonia rhodophyticola TaxID=3137370 RepID=A0AAN0MCU0_9RHOB